MFFLLSVIAYTYIFPMNLVFSFWIIFLIGFLSRSIFQQFQIWMPLWLRNIQAFLNLHCLQLSGNTWSSPWKSKQFSCDICLKSFSNKNSLQNHLGVHKGKTLCPICNKHLSTVSNLKAHMAHKHPGFVWILQISGNTWSSPWQNKLQFSCDICFKSFSNKKSLQNHLGIHKGKTTCQICNTVFSTTSNLNFHMRKIHNLSGIE